LPKLIKFIIAKILLKFMRSIFGGGRININRKLKKEVEKIDKDIIKLFNEFREPSAFLHPISMEQATNSIKRTLEDIKQYKNLLKSYSHNLNNFPEINQLENSIKKLLKILEETHTSIYKLHQRVRLDQIIQNIKMNLYEISDSWNKHKYELHELRIIK